jgi:transcriptional regulator with XRE-family HTH domain
VSPEIVAAIRASTEPGSTIARRLGICRQTVSKIRTGKSHVGPSESLLAREAKVQAILNQSPALGHAEVAALAGVNRDTARRVRLGLKWADVLPELPRLDPTTWNASCLQCSQWEADGERCMLGIPECRSEGPTWARGCGAYLAR